jgi:phage shock protein E
VQGEKMEMLKQNWPFILLFSWLAYRWFSTRQLKKRLPELKKQGATLVDVRSQGEFLSGHANGSVNIPLNELSSRLNEIPKSGPVLVACASGSRSGMARMLLKRHGYKNVYNMGNWSNLEAQ